MDVCGTLPARKEAHMVYSFLAHSESFDEITDLVAAVNYESETTHPAHTILGFGQLIKPVNDIPTGEYVVHYQALGKSGALLTDLRAQMVSDDNAVFSWMRDAEVVRRLNTDEYSPDNEVEEEFSSEAIELYESIMSMCREEAIDFIQRVFCKE
jgi:hypothetical protein